MIIDKKLLDELTAKAKESPRLRMNMDLRNSSEDTSQRILNAIEPGTEVPIHRHRNTSETVVMLRGRAVQWLYDDDGEVVGNVKLSAGGCNDLNAVPAMNVEKGQWHRIESLESGTVILEVKDGAYQPMCPEDVMK